ncbi:NYN domain-containing protein [Actinocatenispora comari]|uniref:NYN domain-containing protein n=1 Tax=Actinocatenispora comari TaxID=2807577 RepID=A0A8J4EPG9_9ACTN|nr:NYN domain-containing protein [Actinocatenispora comari]GIL30803.1 hypothetical protein NUM_60570 [Actinocatenispora comari]
MATVTAYIDGFNLYHGLRARYQHRYLWLDLPALVRRLRPRDSITAVRYFTAMVRDDPPAEARQRAYLAALEAHNGADVQIVRGRYQSKNQRCRSCGATWTSYEEKETDVNIAVSLVADAAQAVSDMALIISADSDLCPAIRTARTVATNLGNHLGVIAAFPPRRQSHELRTLASTFTLAQADIRNSLLPAVVTDPKTGQTYHRPSKWR